VSEVFFLSDFCRFKTKTKKKKIDKMSRQTDEGGCTLGVKSLRHLQTTLSSPLEKTENIRVYDVIIECGGIYSDPLIVSTSGKEICIATT
jgi:hypothetical protein